MLLHILLIVCYVNRQELFYSAFLFEETLTDPHTDTDTFFGTTGTPILDIQ